MTKVLLLTGGNTNEREVSLRSGIAIEAGLLTSGYEVKRADPYDDDFDIGRECQDCDTVFIAIHGADGEDGVYQEQLEKLGKPFVGCDSLSSKLCWDKWDYQKFLEQHSISFPATKLVSTEDLDDEFLRQPFVLKPARGGSSLDTLIVRNPSSVNMSEVKDLLAKYPEMLIQELIVGTEITVPVLGSEALPVIEIIPPESGEFDYQNKYNGATQELCPPQNVSQDIQRESQELAELIHRLCGCREMSRTDFIIDQNQKLFVLETNTIPGLTDQSLFPKSAKVAGISMAGLVDKLVKSSLNI